MHVELTFLKNFCSVNDPFKINGIHADVEDFGKSIDTIPGERYGCGNMEFIKKQPTVKILRKYSITIEEYEDLCEKLETGLSFGTCNKCC